jgi:Domain of unknown function (DUF4129)
LYRAALSRLMSRHGYRFSVEHTEAECARIVAARNETVLSEPFGLLTRLWQNLAYAHRMPDHAQFEQLCTRWREAFDD